MLLLMAIALQEVDGLVDRAFPAGGPGGVVLVQRKGEVLYRKARGWADVKAKTPLTMDSVFDLASLSKPFTALAVLALEERGKLALDDDIRRTLPELPDRGNPIRI